MSENRCICNWGRRCGFQNTQGLAVRAQRQSKFSEDALTDTRVDLSLFWVTHFTFLVENQRGTIFDISGGNTVALTLVEAV